MRPVGAVLGSAAILLSFLFDEDAATDLRDSVLGIVVIAATSLIPLVRLWWPAPQAIAAAVAGVALLVADAPVAPPSILLAIALYTVTKRRPTRDLAIASGITTAIVVVLVGALHGNWTLVLPAVLIVGMGAVAADAARVRAVYFDAIHDHVERVEANRESDARRRVVEERLRIARDLHDALAHQVAVINLHSGVASRALDERPEDAERSLATIRQAARTVLEEMSEILSVLRGADGDPSERASRRPVGTLDDLAELVAQFAEIGLVVRVTGETGAIDETDEVDEADGRAVSHAVSMVAYRVIQEGLANAHKHGDGRDAAVRVVHGRDALLIEVSNPVLHDRARTTRAARDGVIGSGHGLIGLRERVAAAGGSIEHAGVDGDRFRLLVRLSGIPEAVAGHRSSPDPRPVPEAAS